jgi:hypothetical protein
VVIRMPGREAIWWSLGWLAGRQFGGEGARPKATKVVLLVLLLWWRPIGGFLVTWCGGGWCQACR